MSFISACVIVSFCNLYNCKIYFSKFHSFSSRLKKEKKGRRRKKNGAIILAVIFNEGENFVLTIVYDQLYEIMNEIEGEGNELFLNYTLYTILLSLLQREIEKLSFKLLHSYRGQKFFKILTFQYKEKKKGYWNIIYFQTLSSKKRKKKKNKVKKRLIPIP